MVTGRLGYLTNDSTLLYGKVGLGVAQVTANPEFFTFGSGGTQWLAAHQMGAGIETMLNENASLRLEGLLTTVDQGFVVDLTQTDQATLFPSAVSANAGLSWRF
jgi:opacity protein-like surface antigen